MRPANASTLLLRLLLAAGALLGGLDVHGLELGPAAHGAAAPDGGGPQAHGEDCSHRDGIIPPHTHDCMACKAGAARAMALPLGAASRLADVRSVCRPADGASLAPRTRVPGTLGARGPPGPEA